MFVVEFFNTKLLSCSLDKLLVFMFGTKENIYRSECVTRSPASKSLQVSPRLVKCFREGVVLVPKGNMGHLVVEYSFKRVKGSSFKDLMYLEV